MSLTALANLVHYSKSHLSKVETGAKAASPDLARRCDALLGCGGALAALVPTDAPSPPASDPATAGDVWVLGLAPDGSSRFSTASRSDIRAVDAGRSVRTGILGLVQSRIDEPTLASFRVLFDEMRRLGQRTSGTILTPTLVTHTQLLRTLAVDAPPALRNGALVLAARFAEYAGWMAQEDGDDDGAEWWTGQAVELATAGEDTEMAAYALVRRALITLYRHDGVATVALAQQAQQAPASPRVRGLAAQREAQGHAIAGNYDDCFRALERAATHLQAPAVADGPVIGTSHVADPVAVATGWCLFDLGHPARAAQILEEELERIPMHASRARARFGARLALAYAGSGELDQACAAVDPVLGTHNQVDSATVRVDLRSLARTLNRWNGNPAVRRTMARITAALHTAKPVSQVPAS